MHLNDFSIERRNNRWVRTFKTWFDPEAVPEIESHCAKVLVCGVETGNENVLHFVMETPSMEPVQELMGSDDFTEKRKNAGVLVETTELTFLKS